MPSFATKLIIIAGPTAVGKTTYAIQLAQHYGTEIVSCDSRQFYSELNIGVARPSAEELSAVRHHFIACRSVTQPYDIYRYEQDAIRKIEELFIHNDVVIAVGGSGLYIDALIHPPARLPDPTPELRAELQHMSLYEKRAQLRLLDPDYYSRVDLCNPVRLQRALEVCLMAGRPYSRVVVEQEVKQRPFEIEVKVLQAEHVALRSCIDHRVDLMINQGLLDEVRSVAPYRNLTTLRTVGYRELFPVLDGTESLENAIAQVKLNTWHYARKQLTWMRKYL